jgi:hypothetical protein
MQLLIYKTELVVERAPGWLAPNSPIELRAQAHGTVVAFAQRPPRLLPLFGQARAVRIGGLDETAGVLLRPALAAGLALRVRIVELHPSHLTVDRRARVSVSVWGGVARMAARRTFANAGYP